MHGSLPMLRDLAAYLASGCKPAADFTIGTEHEAFGFRLTDFGAAEL